MNPIKVKYTEPYKNTIVCRGKLLFLKYSREEKVEKFGSESYNQPKPIIISQTEKHPNHLGYYDGHFNSIIKHSPTWLPNKFCEVILSLPEHFSPEHIQQITDGKLKHGDEVFIECWHSADTLVTTGGIVGAIAGSTYKCIKLTNNHVTLFPFKQKEENWDESWAEILEKSNATNIHGLKLFLEDYYNPPTRK